jgi:hypothetical protein
MAAYYNKTRGPLSITLANGESMCLGTKKWVTLSPEDEGSSSLAEALRRGFLVKSKIDATVLAPVVAPVPAPAIQSAPVAVTPPQTVATPASNSNLVVGFKANRKGR